jgi:hypothetical protein
MMAGKIRRLVEGGLVCFGSCGGFFQNAVFVKRSSCFYFGIVYEFLVRTSAIIMHLQPAIIDANIRRAQLFHAGYSNL